jgi:anti-anti-sigma factor
MIETQLRSPESIVCTPWGDLDWIGAMSLRHVMTDVIQPGVEVVIDLDHVNSVDAVGVSALVGSSRRARAIGCTVRIRNATPHLCRLLERLELHWVLDSSVEDDNDAP